MMFTTAYNGIFLHLMDEQCVLLEAEVSMPKERLPIELKQAGNV